MKIVLLLFAFSISLDSFAYRIAARGEGYRLMCKGPDGGHCCYSGHPSGWYATLQGAYAAAKMCPNGIYSVIEVESGLKVEKPKLVFVLLNKLESA